MKLKISILVITFLFTQMMNAQFNTLTRTVSKKDISATENLNDLKKETIEITKEGKKNSLLNIFKSTSKVELKKEIDSLKSIMMKNNSSKIKDQKFDFKRIEDSLILILKTNANVKNISKSVKTFGFIDDNEQNLVSKIHMPLKNGISVTSSYGNRTHPIFGGRKLHNGADLKANYEKVYSVMDGKVTASGWDPKGGGNYIKVKHSDSFVTAYLHLSEIYYKVGEFVKAGFIIAKSGNSGNSTGPHLHFSVIENGNYINPIRFLYDLIKANNLIAQNYAN
ncbi:Peptidase family M23 [Halpernia humi]|uniref:Peptidase family M23 n=1 Tax=Halpernia humi TaxID=493375 RepID=A0A1H5X5I1_9FLAO|nr:M23 family metallopeptidase [Halpernia humi]SEG06991.1 Peptidase family M23 [Halpernia humi]